MTDLADLPMTTLPDGTVIPTATLQTATMSLKLLASTNFVATFELIEMCRRPGHTPFGNSGEVLKRMGLVRADNSVHADTRAVVLASFTGEGMDITFRPVGG